jgi:hydroxypyruvate isomerase
MGVNMKNHLPAKGVFTQEAGKLVCSTLVYRDLDVFQAMELIAADGFVLLELCIVPGFCPHFDLVKFSIQDAQRLKTKAEELGLSIVSINVNVGSLSGPNVERTLGLVERSIDLAKVLGGKILVLPSGSPVPADEWERSVREINASLVAVADLAARHGIVITIESPHVNSVVGTLTTNPRIRSIDMNYKSGIFAKGYEYTFYRSIESFMNESFMNAYVSGAEPETSAMHGVYIMQLERAVCESNRHGKKVLLAEWNGNSKSH